MFFSFLPPCLGYGAPQSKWPAWLLALTLPLLVSLGQRSSADVGRKPAIADCLVQHEILTVRNGPRVTTLCQREGQPARYVLTAVYDDNDGFRDIDAIECCRPSADENAARKSPSALVNVSLENSTLEGTTKWTRCPQNYAITGFIGAGVNVLPSTLSCLELNGRLASRCQEVVAVPGGTMNELPPEQWETRCPKHNGIMSVMTGVQTTADAIRFVECCPIEFFKCNTTFCSSFADCDAKESTCTCANGYTGNGSHCEEITCANITAATPATIGNSSRFGHTPGSQVVVGCEDGYHGEAASWTCGRDGKWEGAMPVCSLIRCADSDYDDRSTHRSITHGPMGNFTINTLITYTCRHGYNSSFTAGLTRACQSNGKLNGSAPVCVDVDECQSKSPPCHDNALCTNVDGAFRCSCPVGFDGDGSRTPFGCVDKNECTTGTVCETNAYCVNSEGSYYCKACPKGFESDGSYCEPTNECAKKLHNCHEKAVCHDTRHSYNCTCVHGYHGDGRNCEMNSECSPGSRTTCQKDEVCVQIAGVYRCKLITANSTRNDTSLSSSLDSSATELKSLLPGIVVAVLLPVIAVVVAVLIYRRRRKVSKAKRPSQAAVLPVSAKRAWSLDNNTYDSGHDGKPPPDYAILEPPAADDKRSSDIPVSRDHIYSEPEIVTKDQAPPVSQTRSPVEKHYLEPYDNLKEVLPNKK